jgi:disulfide bond formation protein DsbB
MLNFLAIGTYLSWIAIIVLLITKYTKPKSISFRFIQKHALKIAFGLTLIATIGSLYLSEILLIIPCTLCWYQRILTYSQMIILGIAAYIDDFGIKKYLIPINILGLLISGYHILIQTISADSIFCALGSGCSNAYYTLGITVPMMSATIYASVLLLLVIAKR